MADEPENTQRPMTAGELEARIAALEMRLNEVETRLHRRVNDVEQIRVSSLASRLSQLETRHENLLRHTPEAREEPNYWGTALTIIAVIVIIIYALGTHK